jgi:uncharacterized membrane protein YphA (DoxX/SURF4 family)
MILGGVAIAGTGAQLLIGLLTSAAGASLGFYAIAIVLSWLPTPLFNLLDCKVIPIFLVSMALTILMVGPGAFSLDARIFGRREIIIPPRSPRA